MGATEGCLKDVAAVRSVRHLGITDGERVRIEEGMAEMRLARACRRNEGNWPMKRADKSAQRPAEWNARV